MAPLSLEALGWLLVGSAAVKGDGSAAALTAALRGDKTAGAQYGVVRTMLRRFGYSDVLDLYRSHEATARWIETGVLPNGEADAEYGLRAASSRVQQYVTLCALCNPERRCGTSVSSGAPEAAVSLFRARMMDGREALDAERDESLVTERERENILPWDTIQEMYKRRRGTMAPEARLVADLYLLSPLENPPKRLDYGAVRLVAAASEAAGGIDATVAAEAAAEASEAREVREAAKGDVLILCPVTRRGVLRLRAYKTHWKYGVFVQELPRRLVDAVLEGLPSNGATPGEWRGWLLEQRGKKGVAGPMSESVLSARLKGALRWITNRNIGASNLRKSFLSHLLNVPDLSTARLKEIARLMMHSLEAQREYRRVDLDF